MFAHIIHHILAPVFSIHYENMESIILHAHATVFHGVSDGGGGDGVLKISGHLTEHTLTSTFLITSTNKI